MPSCSGVTVRLALVAAFSFLGAAAEDCDPYVLHKQGHWAKALHCLQFNCADLEFLCSDITDCHAVVPLPVTFRSQIFFEVWQVCPASCGMCRVADASEWTAVEAAIGQPCEGGWEYISGVCLKHFVGDLDYVDSGRQNVTWHYAQDRCRAQGAQLANVDAAPHRHMALELVRRRPRDLHAFAAMAWVSWPGGYASGGGTQASNDSGSLAVPRAWLNSYDAKGMPSNIETFRVEVGLDQIGGTGLARIGGWVCSKPARFWEIESGSCEEAGLRTVDSLQACEAAARLLNLADAPAVSFPKSETSFPAGCYYTAIYGHDYSATRLDFRREGNGVPFNGSDLGGIQICMPAPSASNPEYDQNVSSFTGETASGDKTDETRTHEAAAMQVGEDETSNVQLVLCVSCIICYCVIVLVAVLNRRQIRYAGCSALDFLRFVFRRFAALQPSRRDSPALEHFVASAMCRRRARLACFAAAVMLTLHLFWITRLALEPMAPCGGQGSAAEAEVIKAMLGHLFQILTASVFLALQAMEVCSGRWAIRVFAVASLAQNFTQEATLGGHPILWQDRIWYMFLLQIMVGVSLDVPTMVVLLIVRSAGTMFLYFSSIPDNMIPVRFATRCTELWSADVALKTIDDFEVINEIAFSFKTTLMGATMTNLRVLLNFVAGESTSASAFATSEAVQCLALILGLVAVGHVMAEEIRTTVRVQNSQSNSTAVSNILDRLCDAVVVIDSQFLITKSAPRLAGLLATSTCTSLVGMDLRGRMPPEDAESLTARLESGLEGADCASEPLSLSLVDSLAIRVPCEFFLAEFHDTGMVRNYVIGINEVGERDREAARCTVGSVSMISAGLALPPLQEHVLDRFQESIASEDGASSAGSQSECAFTTMTTESVTLDFKYLNGEITAVSPAFNALVGSNNAVGTSILDIMGTKEKTCFLQWLRTTAASFENVQLPQVAVSEPIQLKLRLHGRSQSSLGNAHERRRTHRRQWAVLTVTFPEFRGQEEASDPPANYVLNMEITKISGQPRKASEGSETGFLSREEAPGTLPQEGSGAANVIGRPVVGL